MGILIIADDFTGANDTGVKIFKRNIPTSIYLDGLPKTRAIENCCVVNTETRALSSDRAYNKVRDYLKELDLETADLVYKKIDSTLRGNIGSEIDSILHHSSLAGAIIAPAYPKCGRIVVGGFQLVNNQLLEDTEFARDYKNPIKDSYLPDLLAKQSESQVYPISIKEIRSGNLQDLIVQKLLDGYKLFILDSVETGDLDRIAESMESYYGRFLWVGSAGLADSIAKRRVSRNKSFRAPLNYAHEVGLFPTLVLAGSMNSMTRRQIQYLAKRGYSIFEIDPLLLLDHRKRDGEIQELIQEVERKLFSENCCVLTTKQNEKVRAEIKAFKDLHQLTNIEIGNKIAYQFGRIGAILTKRVRLAGLVLTGGDIAFHTCDQLDINKVEIIGEVEEGIPLALYRDKQNNYLRIVTKAGGFGKEDTLAQAIFKINEFERR